MKVTYIYHSGFAVELDKCVLLFDYYMGELSKWQREKEIYVFASHKHKDHFNLKIFELAKQYEKIHFFLGNDIKLNEKYLERNGISPSVKEKITNVRADKTLDFHGIRVQALRSTDAGAAFVVQVQQHLIYHAGDLNWWHWEGEPYPFNENMERDYKKEIDKLQGLSFTAAFVPLDPRLGISYGWGMDYFLEHVEAKHIFPMHLWEEYGTIDKYKKTKLGNKYRERITDIREAGQEFDVWNI